MDAAKRLGSDLVKCTTVYPTCGICAQFQGRVYSVSGKDKRFPALYETALKRGYQLIHPNCRHEFLPYFEELQLKEQLEKDRAFSNRPFDRDYRGKKEKENYQNWQVFNRQVREERVEYNTLKATLGNRMPYKTIGGFRRARRAKSPEYLELRKSVRKIREGATKEIVPAYNRVIDAPEYRAKFEHLDLPQKVVTAVKDAARRCVKINDRTTLERAVLIDAKNGSLVQNKAGIAHSVFFSEAEFRGSRESSIVIVHNHPRGDSFSPEDLIFMMKVKEVRTIIAAGHNGTVYSLTVGIGKRVDDDIYLEYNKLKENYNNDLHKVVSELSKRYQWRYERK